MGPKCKTFAEFIARYEGLGQGIILHGYVAQWGPEGQRSAHDVLRMQAMDRHHYRMMLQEIWDTEICPTKPAVCPWMQRLGACAKNGQTKGQTYEQPKQSTRQ